MDAGLTAGSFYTIRNEETADVKKPGYTFTGWNTQSDGTGTGYAPGDVITVTGNVLLFAQWA